MKELRTRFLVSSAIIAFLVMLISMSENPLFQPVFVAVFAAVVGIALWEFYRLAEAKGFTPFTHTCIFAAVVMTMATYLSALGAIPQGGAFAVLIIASSCLLLGHFGGQKDPIATVSVSIMGLLYVGVSLTMLLHIMFMFPEYSRQDGRWWVAYVLIVTKLSDIGGYFVGRGLGWTKLAEHISPNKTVEGAFGGVLASTLGSIACFMLSSSYRGDPLGITVGVAIALGVAMGISAQLGDLAESLLKRDAGVKDSNSLPALGGVLDMVDSLLFSTPLAYGFLRLYF